ncbi:hypothetical protein RRG08_052343 [Elysia crispata]|uniref:Uncharacterized protein n=1 Tax=Elysia crispata TaxID=231223 RepID=A0AAE1A6U1_9GAST|nr:hypothetical protein RRG08_052343 [Elysia crispata]
MGQRVRGCEVSGSIQDRTMWWTDGRFRVRFRTGSCGGLMGGFGFDSGLDHVVTEPGRSRATRLFRQQSSSGLMEDSRPVALLTTLVYVPQADIQRSKAGVFRSGCMVQSVLVKYEKQGHIHLRIYLGDFIVVMRRKLEVVNTGVSINVLRRDEVTYQANKPMSRFKVAAESHSGQDCNFTGDDCDFTGDDCDFTGDDCDFAGDDCDFTGDDCNFTNDDCDFAGDDCDLTDDECDFTGDDCNFTGDDCDFTGDDCDFTDDDCDFPGDDCDFTGYECDFTDDECAFTGDDCDFTDDECAFTGDNCDFTDDDCDFKWR